MQKISGAGCDLHGPSVNVPDYKGAQPSSAVTPNEQDRVWFRLRELSVFTAHSVRYNSTAAIGSLAFR